MGFDPPLSHFHQSHAALAYDGEPDSHRKIIFALQGGSGLIGFTHGAIKAALKQSHIRVLGVTATSSAAILGAYLTEGLIHGDHAYANHRMDVGMKGLSQFQAAHMPAWVDGYEKMQRLFYDHSPYSGFRRASIEMLQKINFMAAYGKEPVLQNWPIMDFFNETVAGRSLNFAALNRAAAPFMICNSVCAPPGVDPWKLAKDDERLHATAAFLPDAGPITPEAINAGGSPFGMVHPYFYQGEFHRDGAYLSNPDLGDETLGYAEREDATLVIGCTRPLHFSGNGSDFHNVTLTKLKELQENRPKLKLVILAPEKIEYDPSSAFALTPELDFGERALKLRQDAGYRAMERALKTNTLLAPPSRPQQIRGWRPDAATVTAAAIP